MLIAACSFSTPGAVLALFYILLLAVLSFLHPYSPAQLPLAEVCLPVASGVGFATERRTPSARLETMAGKLG